VAGAFLVGDAAIASVDGHPLPLFAALRAKVPRGEAMNAMAALGMVWFVLPGGIITLRSGPAP